MSSPPLADNHVVVLWQRHIASFPLVPPLLRGFSCFPSMISLLVSFVTWNGSSLWNSPRLSSPGLCLLSKILSSAISARSSYLSTLTRRSIAWIVLCASL